MGEYEEQIKSLEENINSITKSSDDWHVLCRLDHKGISFPIKVTPDILEEFNKTYPSQEKLKDLLPFIKRFNFANNTFIVDKDGELLRSLYIIYHLLEYIISRIQKPTVGITKFTMLSLPKVLLLSFKI